MEKSVKGSEGKNESVVDVDLHSQKEIEDEIGLEDSGDNPEARPSRVLKVVHGVGSAYKFAWYTCLGTALTLEETVTGFSKKMAAKGSGHDFSPAMLTRRFEAPKAKIDHARAEFRSKAQKKIVGVEHALDEGVNRSLHFIGVPSRKDMNQMTSLMQDMAESITELSSQLQAQKSAPTSRSKKSKTDAQTSVV